MLKRSLIILAMFIGIVNVGYANSETAVFATGCFWCAQSDFDQVNGVTKTVVGYDGGASLAPTYAKVSSGDTNYAEAIQVTFDNNKISYAKLLDYFWHHVDPTVQDAQFCDHGHQYRSAIFYLNQKQHDQALASLVKIKQIFPQVYTDITPSTHFYNAEEYHQDYYKKNTTAYHFYRWNCGRDQRIKELWHVQ